MKVAYLGNFGVPWTTETHVAASIESLGHSVTRIQEGEVRALEVPFHVADHDLFVWTQTFSLAEAGGTRAERFAMLEAIRSLGVPSVGFHLDRWWGLEREDQIRTEPFFRCLPGETLVETASMSGVSRRWYTGELVRITAGEYKLAATPNHPVLTARGWCPIGEIKKGDDLLCYVSLERASPRRPDVKNPPLRIEQIFQAACKAPDSFTMRRKGIRGISMEFHGDGMKSDVDVVWPGDGLMLWGEPFLGKPTQEFSLLLAMSASMHRLKPSTVVAAIGSARDGELFVERTKCDVGFYEDLIYDSCHSYRETKRLADREDRFSGLVTLHDILAQRVPSFARSYQSLIENRVARPDGRIGSMQPFVNGSDRDPERVRKLLHRFSPLVSLAQVDQVSRESFAGHVYNLSTDEGAYLAQGIITHNCDILFTADGGNADRWESEGITHVWSPPAVFAEEAVRGASRPEYRSRVAFVGSWRHYGHPAWTHRAELVRHLRRRWRAALWPRNGAIRGRDLSDLYASVWVLVGDSCLVPRADGPIARYHSDRVPETLGRGGFLIHPHVEGVTDGTLYTAGKHLATWNLGDWSGLDAQIGHYLQHHDERNRIASDGRIHVIGHHTYADRWKRIFEILRIRGLLRTEVPA